LQTVAFITKSLYLDGSSMNYPEKTVGKFSLRGRGELRGWRESKVL
jgi:hypothetical protein